ncbi:MAG: helix-turn-helix domain-containing protein, partial [Actinobacteria bacterium]|nr:helix-turn-helix domain-containing protein [Actinomycetota bacterium]
DRMSNMSSWAGNLIKLARKDAGLSQRELAKRAGTSQATIAAYEGGRKQPTLATLARVVRAADRDLRIIVTERDNHDEAMHSYEESLPPATVQRRRRRDLRMINRARKERGLPPVTEDDLVRA